MIGASNFSIPSFLAKILILCQFCSCAYFTFCILTKRIPSLKGKGAPAQNRHQLCTNYAPGMDEKFNLIIGHLA
jgi:hypothetical protein